MPTTEEVVADMLVENTGRHFLDSGGAYGRQWERNQAAVGATDLSPAEFYKAQPEAWVEWDYALVSVFHFLTSRLDYAPELDRRFRLWVRMDPSERWSDSYRTFNSYDTVEEFHEAWKRKGWIDRHAEWDGSGGLTYNSENVVSQDFHWYFFSTTEDSPVGEDLFAFVNIHNGCDARGGYTDFRAFRVGDHDGAADLLDFAHVEIVFECPACKCGWNLDVRDGYSSLYDFQGNDLGDNYRRKETSSPLDGLFEIEHPVCPVCGNTPTTTAYMPPVG